MFISKKMAEKKDQECPTTAEERAANLAKEEKESKEAIKKTADLARKLREEAESK